MLQRLAWSGLRHGLESKLELGLCGPSLDWRGLSDRGWLLLRGDPDRSRRGSGLDWGGSGLDSDLLGPGDRLDGDWSALYRLGLANSDGLRHRGRPGLLRGCGQSEGTGIDRTGHRGRARSGLGLVLAERLENEESVGWRIGNRLGGGPGSLRSRGGPGSLGSGGGLTDNLLGHGLGKVLGNVEGLEVELDSSSRDGLDCGGSCRHRPGLLSGDGGGGGGGHSHGGQGGGGGLEGASGLRGAGGLALRSRGILDIETLAGNILLEAGLECPGVLVEGDGAGE